MRQSLHPEWPEGFKGTSPPPLSTHCPEEWGGGPQPGGRAHGLPLACGLTQSLTPGCISALGSAEWLYISNFGLESGVAFADKEEMQPG